MQIPNFNSNPFKLDDVFPPLSEEEEKQAIIKINSSLQTHKDFLSRDGIYAINCGQACPRYIETYKKLYPKENGWDVFVVRTQCGTDCKDSTKHPRLADHVIFKVHDKSLVQLTPSKVEKSSLKETITSMYTNLINKVNRHAGRKV